MNTLSKSSKSYFKKCGGRGGRIRSKRLSRDRRRAIAKLAAQHRWKNNKPCQLEPFHSVRLNSPGLNNPVYLEEILTYGLWSDWHELYKQISNYPFGPESQALQKVLLSHNIYGTTELWKGILCTLRGGTS